MIRNGTRSGAEQVPGVVAVREVRARWLGREIETHSIVRLSETVTWNRAASLKLWCSPACGAEGACRLDPCLIGGVARPAQPKKPPVGRS